MERIKFETLYKNLESKKISSEELIKESLKKVKQYDPVLECFTSLQDQEELINQAKLSDERRAQGKQAGPIDGIPVAVKDNIHSMGLKTTCASKILTNYNPPYDATSVRKIKEQGAIVFGKTNLDEFAMGSTCETSAYKHTKNPWNIEHVPGGSSGGSAAAVASGMIPLAYGSDTGGSIRQPAAFCGIVGIKPTYGLVSRLGLVAYASSLDQIGPMANDVFGTALMLNYISGYDAKESTSLNVPQKNYLENLHDSVKGLKVAVFPEFYGEGVSDEIRENFNQTLTLLKSLGMQVEEVHFPALKYVISAYYFIATAEASSNLSRYDGVKYGLRSSKHSNYDEMLLSTRTEGFGKEVKKRIMLGNFVLSSGYYDAYYRKAQKLRAYIMQELKKVLSQYDVLASPTTPDIAFKFGEVESDPMKMYLGDVTTVLGNLSGLPGISVPSGIVNQMPVGLQLFGNPLSENLLFNIAYQFEKELNQEFVPDLSKLENIEIKSKKKSSIDLDSQGPLRYDKEHIQAVSKQYMAHAKDDGRSLCKDLRPLLGKKVKVAGMIYRMNNLGGIEFYTLKDRSGMTQLVWEGKEKPEKLTILTNIEIEGLVTEEDRSPYDNIEIKVDSFKIIGKAAHDIPINVSSSYANINLPTILDNRPISVRNLKVQKVFKIQSEIIRLYSQYLRDKDFTEMKTPKIIDSSTEGGANIFELKYFERSAFLAQSPQFYKQIMVGSGFERVFEVGPVFRAEKHKTIRHLNEYTSLDFEMAFIRDEQDVIDTQENLLKYIISELKDNFGDILDEIDPEGVDIPQAIPRIHFLEALEIAYEAGASDLDGDLSPEAERMVCDYFLKEKNCPFVYIIGYPIPKRPMYTMPDERLPGYTRSFDLLFRGLEITTGSQRIHDYEQLRESMIKFGCNPAEFSDYLSAFKYGMPPHGGLGMGLERLTMRLLNLANIREATLFPRDITRLNP